MFTFSYKGHYIHGYCAKSEAQVQFMKSDGSFKLILCKSVRAAKLLITRKIKESTKELL